MNSEELKSRIPEKEFSFSSSRSGGPGGQNVNKVSTKMELRFNLDETLLLTEPEKVLIHTRLGNKINNAGDLILVSQSERSQLLNKELVTEKFYDLVSRALTVSKPRSATKPTYSSKLRRLDTKKKVSRVKSLRKKETGKAEE